MKGFLLGLRLGVGGLVAKEVRSRSRGFRPPLLLTAYLLLLSGAVLGFLALVEAAAGVLPATLGMQLFSTLSLGAVVLLAFVAPALTAGAISGERERRTLDLLLVTRASPLGLVTGKLLGSLLYGLFLLAASLPAFALVYLYGGVPPRYVALVFLVAAVTAATHAAVALLLSAWLRRTLPALVLSYVLVLGLVFGVPFVAGVMNVAGQAGMMTSVSSRPVRVSVGMGLLAAPAWYTAASPVVSLASVLPAGNSPEGDMVGAIARGVLLPGGLTPQPADLPPWRRQYVVGFDPMTGTPETFVGWAPWVYQLGIGALTTLASVLLAALAVAPVKPWRARRTRGVVPEMAR